MTSNRMARWKVGAAVACCAFLAWAAPGQVAVRARTLHTSAGPPITDGVVVITDGKIAAVGPASWVVIPAGHTLLECAVATPGLIDARATVGLTGIYNIAHDQDQLEGSAPIQPELRAIDAYNPQEELVAYVRSFGITTVHTGHAPGELVSGQTLVVKTVGNTVEEAMLRDCVAVSATLDESAQKGGGKSPGTRPKAVAMLRSELIRAKEYQEKRAAPEEAPDGAGEDNAPPQAAPGAEGQEEKKDPNARDLKLEVLARVLDGELPLMVYAQRAHDIDNALRLQKEFGFRMWLDGGAEAYLRIDELKEAGVPVIVHPTMARSWGSLENASMETAAKLADAGVPVYLQSGFESYVPKVRIVLFEAAVAAANGLGPERALQAMTIDAATLLGVDDRVGSLAPGKDGDVAMYDGDPFEYTTHCVGVVVDGQIVSSTPR